MSNWIDEYGFKKPAKSEESYQDKDALEYVEKIRKNKLESQNWFERKPLTFKLLYHFIGGVLVGILFSVLFL